MEEGRAFCVPSLLPCGQLQSLTSGLQSRLGYRAGLVTPVPATLRGQDSQVRIWKGAGWCMSQLTLKSPDPGKAHIFISSME